MLQLQANEWYKIDVSTYRPRYGTWKYRVHVRNPNGNANEAGSIFIDQADSSGSLTFQAQQTGTYYV